ncbi:THUMP domain-containing protein 1-like [Ornithodoros turicata]|uniref:THUMP domain-containing protein 1-like n=1 Tax=Ornithodoros turicata TaxID=34597 RepID=UPI0031388A54
MGKKDHQAGKKHKKNFYKNYDGKNKGRKVEPDMKGFLVTFDKKEYDAARDCFSILNEYAEKLWGPEEGTEEGSDVEQDLEEELKALKDKSRKRFQKLKTDVPGNFFMKTTVQDPALLVTTILEDIKRTQQQKSRYILRLLPILATCKAHVDNIKKATEAVLSKYSDCPDDGTRYLIVHRVRHNDQVKNAPLTSEMISVVKEVKPNWVPDLREPQLVLMIDVLHKIGCISLLKGYFDYKKYNIHQLSRLEEEKKRENRKRENNEEEEGQRKRNKQDEGCQV